MQVSGPQPPPQGPGDLVPKESGGDVVAEGTETGTPVIAENPLLGKMEDQDLDEVRQLVRTLLLQSDMARRWQLRRVLRGRDYFDGKFNTVWDDGMRMYVPLSAVNLSQYDFADEEGDTDALLNWNIYQATGMYLISSISGGKPIIRFRPKNADLDLDVQTAGASNDVLDLFYRTNGLQTQLNRQAYLLYNDGVSYAYVRYVADGQRFGFREEPVIVPVMQTLRPAGYECSVCQTFTPEDEAFAAIDESGEPLCPNCGTMLSPSDFRDAITGPIPQNVGNRQVPNGAEILNFYGAPEIRTPPEAGGIRDCTYLCLQTEEDQGFCSALYPHLAEKIQAGTVMAEQSLLEERMARISIKTGTWQGPYGATDGMTDKVTFTRIWIRPYAFFRIKDAEKRQRVLDAFPKGAFFAFAGDLFCESRNESMDDYWVSCHAYPGDGMVRPSIGEVLLDPQDALNDLMDAEIQAARHAVPFLLMNQELMGTEEFKQSKARGGMVYGVEMKDGRSIGEQVFQTGTPAMPASVAQLRQEIFGNISQWLSGALPGMTGQGDPSLKTKGAYAQAREQALGRMGVTWQNILDCWTRIGELAVKHFIENRTTENTVVPEMTPTGFKNRVIKLASLQGQAVAYAENAEAFPLTMSEKRDNLNVLGQASPAVAQGLMAPENQSLVKSIYDLEGLKLPGEKARAKQLKEIQKLLEDGAAGMGPVPQIVPGPVMPGPPVAGPEGMPMEGPPIQGPPQQILVPSVAILPKLDDHAHELAAVVEWLQGEEAETAKQTNPAGYQNVILHGEAHFDAMNGMIGGPGGPPPGGQPTPGGPQGPPPGPPT